MPPASPAPVAVSIAETARMLGISRSQAYALARAGEIPTIRSLGKLVVPVRWIEAQADVAIAAWERAHPPLRAVAS